ncbi:MAG: DUF1294 domain-containing protein [Planctomycetota bacterium]
MSLSAWGWCAGLYVAWVAACSAASAVLIAWDKRQARLNRWRVSEATLHATELLGGWPGSLWMRGRIRHKTIKRSYRQRALFVSALHVAAVVTAIVMVFRFVEE